MGSAKTCDSSLLVRDSERSRFVWKKSVPITDQINELYEKAKERNCHEQEYLQALEEILYSLKPVFEKDPKYLGVFEQIIEPERIIVFRVPWIDDQGIQQINRGFRVQYSSALGPYKGGIRFHPSVNMSVMKFLAFEQIFKNALTKTGIGAGKGGSDFDPKGKSDNEILRFCQSFMTALWEFIGPTVDVPSGDIGVGKREIGYMYGQYKKLSHCFDGTFTGKGLEYSGSYIRPEATGYGAVYFLLNWIKDQPSLSIEGARCIISGSGNVAQYAAELLVQLNAKPITMSDSSGYVIEPNGFTLEQVKHIMHLKNVEKRRISDYCKFSSTAKFHEGKAPWEVQEYKFAFPCATQNEIDENGAEQMAKAGCLAVVEGANMPSTQKAIEVYKKKWIVLCPAKAANAGGVAVSALEMAQNAARVQWTREEVNQKLKNIMKDIYDACKQHSSLYGLDGDLAAGANIAGFLKVAHAVLEQGCI